MLPYLKTNVVFQKEKEKEKEKEKKKKKNKVVKLALKPEHGPRGVWRKPLKPDALCLNWLGAIDLVFITWVDR